MKAGMNIYRGDLVIVNFEPIKGSEQGKIRPAVVLQNDVGNKFSKLTIVVPLTGKIYDKNLPFHVQVVAEDSGLKKDSTVLLNHIRTIDKSRIGKKIGKLDHGIMKKIDTAIKISLDLE
jgi:mRNA interferase MazF